ncbi:MAG: protein kinase [Myxococcota bacterium]|nr:protein kinase [Myxococcota bacterium]
MRICPRCHLHYHEDETRCLVDGAELEEVRDPRVGMVLGGRYVLEDVLGEGGMATVYRARHNLVERPCAVKILHPELSKDSTLRERLRREARSAAAISHPNVVEIYDFGETPTGEPYLVMELLHGSSLRDLMNTPIPVAEVIELGRQMAEGLARAHDLGVVHRDLKPENVFVVPQPNGTQLVKIVDFGLARVRREDRLTVMGQIVGTPPYMAPERFKQDNVTPAADLYALGIVLYEMLVGALPFDSNNVAGFVLAHLEDVPARLSTKVQSVPPALEDLVAELLAKKPEERPVDAHDVARRLSLLASSHVAAPPRHMTTRTSSLPRTVVTLDRWEGRLPIFEAMLTRAYPAGDPPSDLEEHLAAMRAALGRLRALRTDAMAAQRELEGLESEVGARRERLGHAVHVLGVDLSAARNEARRVAEALSTATTEAAEAHARFRDADAALARVRAPGATPTDADVSAARRTLAALEEWTTAQHGIDRLRREQVLAEERERDFGFQVEALRQGLAKVETDLDERAKKSRARLAKLGGERREEEMRVLWLASKITTPLRDRPELRALFDQLEAA